MRHSPCYRPSGITLVEVIASTALVGALLVSILLGFSAHTRQITTAANRAAAIRQLDRTIAAWFAADDFPRNRSGMLAEQPHLRWETTVLQIPSLDESWQRKRYWSR